MNAGAPIQTWWSALQNAERFDHNGMCSLSSLGPDRTAAEIAAGVAPRVKDGPCTHLFVANSSAYLFAQDHSFCCVSSTSKAACHLTRPQASFWNVFDPPTVSDYTSESGYYQGKVKNYTMHLTNPSNFWFWYLTDMHDRPIECEPSLRPRLRASAACLLNKKAWLGPQARRRAVRAAARLRRPAEVPLPPVRPGDVPAGDDRAERVRRAGRVHRPRRAELPRRADVLLHGPARLKAPERKENAYVQGRLGVAD